MDNPLLQVPVTPEWLVEQAEKQRRYEQKRIAWLNRTSNVLDFPAPQYCGHDTGIAPAMQDGPDPNWFFIGRVSNEVIPHAPEPQGP